MEPLRPERLRPVPEAEVAAWVGLSLLPGVGARTVKAWIERAGSAQAAWSQLPVFLQPGKNHEEVLTAWRRVNPAGVVADARARGMAVVAQSDPAYPTLLRMIPDPPPVLYVRGALPDARDAPPAVAIVGSRRATPYGLAAAGRLAFDLGLAGVIVTSGLARGIDGAAHRGALDGGGQTIAVLGSGGDCVYPPEHRHLADAIAARGAVVTELPPGTPPLAAHFPRRNRIISGMSLGVVVVEGATDSGALVTADCALDQGRDVFAVPGSVFSERSRAPHDLLRQGARLVETAGDILRELGLARAEEADRPQRRPGAVGPAATPEAPETLPIARAQDEMRVLEALAAGPRSLDELVESSGLPAGTVAAVVTLLEVQGLIQMLPGQMVMRTPGGTHGSA